MVLTFKFRSCRPHTLSHEWKPKFGHVAGMCGRIANVCECQFRVLWCMVKHESKILGQWACNLLL